MAHDLGELPRDGTVNVFDNIEIRGEEDVEISLVDLRAYTVRIRAFVQTNKTID